jgi:RNA polymerase sigma-70 factor (ECF subfamily)
MRAWRALEGFEGRSSLRSWLHRIATNACLDVIARRPKRVLPIDYGPPVDSADQLGEPLAAHLWLEPYPDEQLGLQAAYAAPEARYEQRESVELAFIAALQHLPPRQRAALILCEVLGFSAREAADTLDTTPAAVSSALQRARASLDERLPVRSQQATLRELGDQRVRDIVESFVDAWDSGDVETMVAVLTEEPTFAMPPQPGWCRGRAAIEAFLPANRGEWRLVPARANGQLAFGAYRRDPQTGVYRAAVLDVLTVRDERIADVTAFATPDIFPRFGLPAELPPSSTQPSRKDPE